MQGKIKGTFVEGEFHGWDIFGIGLTVAHKTFVAANKLEKNDDIHPPIGGGRRRRKKVIVEKSAGFSFLGLPMSYDWLSEYNRAISENYYSTLLQENNLHSKHVKLSINILFLLILPLHPNRLFCFQFLI